MVLAALAASKVEDSALRMRLPVAVAAVLLSALGSALGVWSQIVVTLSLEEDASMPRYVGAAAGVSVGALVARYARARRDKWWTILLRMVVYIVLGYPVVGAILYALAVLCVDQKHGHFVATHLAVFGPVYWFPLLAGFALVERRRASPKGDDPASGLAAEGEAPE